MSGLHCGGPVSNMQAHQTPLMQQFGGVPPKAPATFNPTASHGDTLDQFAQKTQVCDTEGSVVCDTCVQRGSHR